MNPQKVKSSNQTIDTQILTAKDLDIKVDKKQKPLNAEFAIGVRTLLQNWRQGTVGVKARGEVNLSGKKPWKQKGTGRARAGTARSPLWRGGGIVFGPQPRTRTLKTTKKLRNAVMRAVYIDYLTKGKVRVVDWELPTEKPQTKMAKQLLKDIGIAHKKVTLFLPFEDQKTHASFVNIPNVHVLFFDQPSIIELAVNHEWLIFKKDFSLFKEMVAQCV